MIFIINNSKNISTINFLHKITFITSIPTQYNISPNHIKFKIILYKSQITNKINIIPNIKNNQFINKITQLKQKKKQPLLFHTLTKIQKKFSKNFHNKNKQITIIIINNKLHNKHTIIQKIKYLKKTKITIFPIKIKQKIQKNNLKNLQTFTNPIHKINNFNNLYQLSKNIYNSIYQNK